MNRWRLSFFVALIALVILTASVTRALDGIEIRCTGGQGRAEVQVELYETVQSINLT